MNKRISLKDIAQKLGVSTALVSYVLNNRMEGRINKDVAQKIRDTAQKLDYRPNQIAKSLKTNKTFTIGLIVADIANPFFSTLARIVEDEAEKAGYTVIFGSSDEKAQRSQKLLDVFLDRQVDGMIIAPVENTEAQIKLLQKRGIKFVLIDRYFPNIKAASVVIDNYEAAYRATVHLIERGRQRIGMIGFATSLLNLADRKRGFQQAMADHHRPLPEGTVQEISLDATKEEVEAAIALLLAPPHPIDALFFASNKISTAGLKYINTLPVHVPTDLALCSFDDSDATDLFYAPLTHVRQPLLQLGREAVQLLLHLLNDEGKAKQIKLAAEFVKGKST